MRADNKRKRIISLENLPEDILAAFNEKYPGGYNEYLPDVEKYPKPDGTSFYAVTVETEESICLVKIKVKVDDAEDIERWLEGEEEAEAEQVAGTTGGDDSENSTLPDDNIAQYGGDDDGPDA